MAYQSYNGWTGTIREARNGVFFGAIKSGHLDDHQATCIGCGQSSEVTRISLHSEEYGPLPKDYVASCVPVCFRCHFMIHNRFKIPNRWLRYLHRVASGALPDPLVNNWVIANQLLKMGDLPECLWEPLVVTPNGYLSGLSLDPYEGPEKVATVTIHGVEQPDPRLYVSTRGGPVQRKHAEALANIKIPLHTFIASAVQGELPL